MKLNWKVLAVIALIVLVSTWSVSSVMPQSYNGANLSVGVGSGIVTITNPSSEMIPVQLTGTGTRTFAVTSNVEGVGGSSVRQGNSSVQIFDFVAPPGQTELSVARGASVKFVSATDARLEVNVQPLSEGEARTTLLVTAIIVIGGLYYLSRSVEHRWVKTLLRRETPVPLVVAPVAAPAEAEANRGRDGRMYSNYGSKE